MKITVSQLRRIIKEEVRRTLNEVKTFEMVDDEDAMRMVNAKAEEIKTMMVNPNLSEFAASEAVAQNLGEIQDCLSDYGVWDENKLKDLILKIESDAYEI